MDFSSLLSYLGSPSSPPAGSGASSSPSFLQNLGGAFGRSQRAGGGVPGIFAALSPQFASGYSPGGSSSTPAPQNAPAPAPANGAQALNWGAQPDGPQKGLGNL